MLTALLMTQLPLATVAEPAPALPLTGKRDCGPAQGEEVVICGRTEEQSPYRLKPLPPRFERPLLPKAETSALGGRATVEAEQADVGGTPSRRAMVRLKWKF